ncbi:MAG: tripartite tricarboxylate transporter substrate-binding protein [Lautropia sp.]
MPSRPTPSTCRRGLLAAAGALLAAPALAAPEPMQSRTLRSALKLLCTAGPGSVPDIVARRYAERLEGRYARHVVVENRAGAAGRIAVGTLLQSGGDGATALLAQGAVASIYPDLYEALGYDPDRDLRPVSLAAEMTLGFAVGPAVPPSVDGLRRFVDWAASHPRETNVGSPGVGTLPHLFSAMLMREASLAWAHLAYKAGPLALADLAAGQIACLALPEGLLRPNRAAGKLRVLATSGEHRSHWLPDVATVGEQGFGRLTMREWFAFFLPRRAAQDTVRDLSAAVRDAAASRSLATAFDELAMVPVAGTPAEADTRVAADRAQWQPFLRATGMRGAA